MSLQEYIEARKTDRNIFWKTDPGGAENLLDEAIEEIARLRDAISQTLNDNRHLADGEDCTLIGLKKTLRTSGAPWSGDKPRRLVQCAGGRKYECGPLCLHGLPHQAGESCTDNGCGLTGKTVCCVPITQGE